MPKTFPKRYAMFTTNLKLMKKVVWATKNNLDLAIRGGGHSSSGASSTEGGVVGNVLFVCFD